MLLNDLFVVDNWQAGYGTLSALLHVQVPHRIFDGHFPGRPVLPGACLVQLVEELAATVADREVRLIRAGLRSNLSPWSIPSVTGPLR
jgi:3-hydroxyacyl-[acyl-carrier-protein] dehydratase